ncbi:predicted protein [Histoplasma mississippiense (nom. inval.)]|uniref:predicted protein n=1 Tax=Ajellomyces capsulatus (strain NAm1 / WU24) TaxID=2059318 RepID=UPI000157CF09|nr:predicted protein [Histoplasma mississippiense (nom. inval.)]EDN10942.1 predicted protein [Histoplasma mississippiense (nom. inval.)]
MVRKNLQVKENCWAKGPVVIDDNKPCRIKNAPADENEVAGVTGLDLGTLVLRILAVKVFESEIAYREEVAESIVELLLQVQNRDAGTSELRRRLEVGDASVGDRSTWAVDKDGLLRKDGKVYVPQDKAVRHEIMKMNHDDPQGGHFGRDKTIEAIKRKYSWHGMSDEIAEYVRTCDVCQRVKIPRHKPYGLLQPHPVPDKKWHTISMDFIEGLPDNKKGSQTYNAIVVFVDLFTKWAIIVPTSSKLDAERLADIIVWKLAKNFGLPANIISDRDSLINSKFWSTLCYLLHVRRKLSTAFHPQTDGQTERLNQVIEHYLRTYCSYQQDNWIEWIPLAQWAYNNAFHASIKMTPSEAMIGRPTELRIDVEPPSTGASKSAIEQVERMKQAENRIRECLEAAKAAEKKYYDQRHIPKSFKIGDWVMLRAKNISTLRPSPKLDHRFLGPFQIIDIRGTQAYKLKLTPQYKGIHPVFHVSLLEPYHARDGQIPQPEPIIIDAQEEWEVEAILDKRQYRGQTQYLVKWKDCTDADNSWEPEENLVNSQEYLEQFNKTYQEPTDPPQLGQCHLRNCHQGRPAYYPGFPQLAKHDVSTMTWELRPAM